MALFWIESVEINNNSYYVPMYATRNIKFIEPVVNEYFSGNDKWKSDFYKKISSTPTWQKPFDEAIKALAKEYVLWTWTVIWNTKKS